MKILLLESHDLGLYRFRRELIERLLQEGNRVLISVPRGDYVNYFIQIGCEYADTIIDRRGTNPVKDLSLVLFYKNLCKKWKPDVILTYSVKPTVYGGMIGQREHIPYIANITGLGSSILSGGWKEWIVMWLYRISLKKARCVFFQNTMNQRLFLKKKIFIPHMELIHGSGVNIDEFTLLDYPIEPNIEFAFIGRIMKDKGIDEYLKAAVEIKKQYESVIFHICGFFEENYEAVLTKLQTNQVIVYHGQVNKIKEIYKKVHCIILPSYSEGMSNAILEAAACGRPVITSNISGCREAIEDKVTGYLVKKEDYKDLVHKIKTFIMLPWEEKRQMGIAARNKMAAEFDRRVITEKYMKEIIDGNHRNGIKRKKFR